MIGCQWRERERERERDGKKKRKKQYKVIKSLYIKKKKIKRQLVTVD